MPNEVIENAALIALREWLLPVEEVAKRAGVSRMTAYRWAKKVRLPEAAGHEAARAWYDELWQSALRKAEDEMSKVGGSWMVSGRPRSKDEAKARGMEGRRLTREEIAAEAKRLGLPISEDRARSIRLHVARQGREPRRG